MANFGVPYRINYCLVFPSWFESINPFTHQLEDGIPSLRAHRKTLSERVFLDSGALFLDGTGREFGMTPWDSRAGELALVCL